MIYLATRRIDPSQVHAKEPSYESRRKEEDRHDRENNDSLAVVFQLCLDQLHILNGQA